MCSNAAKEDKKNQIFNFYGLFYKSTTYFTFDNKNVVKRNSLFNISDFLFLGNIQHLPMSGKNTFYECGSCLESPIFLPSVLPYVLISLPVNSWVLWLMTSSDIFWTDRMEVSEFHLVLSERVFGVLGTPLMIIGFHFYIEMAQTVTKLINGIFRARILFQSGVCIERYFAVVHPVLYLRYKPLRYRMSFNCFFWLNSIFIAVVQMFFCNRIVMLIHVLCFFVVFSISFFCYVSVLKALKQPSPGDDGEERSNLVKRRAIYI